MVILCVEEPLYKTNIGFEKDVYKHDIWNSITFKEVYKYLWGKCECKIINAFGFCLFSSAHWRNVFVWLKLVPLVVGCWFDVTVEG